MIYQRHVGGFLVFPVHGVWFNFQDLHFFPKSKLAQHGYEEVHKIRWKEAKLLQIEPNTTYRRRKESAHLSLIDHPISQPSLDIWTPIIAAEVKKLQFHPV
jgi:hypothetical protein